MTLIEIEIIACIIAQIELIGIMIFMAIKEFKRFKKLK